MQQANVVFTFTITGQLVITSGVPSVATQGQPFSFQFTATGGTTPYVWSAVGLPAGMTLSSNGLLSGTPTVSGNFSVSVTVSDAG